MRALNGDYEHSKQFTAAEKAAIGHAEQLTRDAKAISEPRFRELKQYFSDEQIVEITLVSCVANFTNRFNDALHIPLDPGLSAEI